MQMKIAFSQLEVSPINKIVKNGDLIYCNHYRKISIWNFSTQSLLKIIVFDEEITDFDTFGDSLVILLNKTILSHWSVSGDFLYNYKLDTNYTAYYRILISNNVNKIFLVGKNFILLDLNSKNETILYSFENHEKNENNAEEGDLFRGKDKFEESKFVNRSFLVVSCFSFPRHDMKIFKIQDQSIELITILEKNEWVINYDINEDGSKFAIICSLRIRFWDLNTGILIREVPYDEPRSLFHCLFLGNDEVLMVGYRSSFILDKNFEPKMQIGKFKSGRNDTAIIKLEQNLLLAGIDSYFKYESKIDKNVSFFSLNFWDTDKGEIFNFGQSPNLAFNDFSISKDRDLIVTTNVAGIVKFWRILNNKLVQTQFQDRKGEVVIRTLINNDILVFSVENVVYFYDFILSKIKHKLVNDTKEIQNILLLSENEAFTIGDTIKKWNLSTGEIIATLEDVQKKFKNMFVFSSISKLVGETTYGNYAVWDTQSLKFLYWMNVGSSRTDFITINKNNTRLFSTGKKSFAFQIWELPQGKCLKTIYPYKDKTLNPKYDPKRDVSWMTIKKYRIFSADFNKKGTLLLTTGYNNNIAVWDLATEEVCKILSGHEKIVSMALFAKNDTMVVSCSQDKTIKIWDYATGEVIRTIKAHNNWIQSIQLSSDESKIISFSDSISMWDFETGNLINNWKVDPAEVIRSAVISPNLQYLAVGGLTDACRIYQTEPLTEIVTISSDNGIINSIIFSKDSKFVYFSSYESAVWQYEITTGIVSKLVNAEEQRTCDKKQLYLSPDGEKLYFNLNEMDLQSKSFTKSFGKFITKPILSLTKDGTYFAVIPSPESDNQGALYYSVQTGDPFYNLDNDLTPAMESKSNLLNGTQQLSKDVQISKNHSDIIIDCNNEASFNNPWIQNLLKSEDVWISVANGVFLPIKSLSDKEKKLIDKILLSKNTR